MLMKSDRIKRCTYMYIALLFFRQLARIRTYIVNPGHLTVNDPTPTFYFKLPYIGPLLWSSKKGLANL